MQSRSASKHVHKYLLWTFCLFTAIQTSSAEEQLTSRFSIEGGMDSDDGENYFIDLSLGLRDFQVGLGYGEGNVTANLNASSGGSVRVTVSEDETHFVSLGGELSDEVGATLGYLEWEQDQEISKETYRLDLTYSTTDWSFTVSPQVSDIEIKAASGSNPIVLIDSDGFSIEAAYYGIFPWDISVTYGEYDFSKNLSSIITSQQLTPYQRLLLRLWGYYVGSKYAGALEREMMSGTVGYSFDWGSLALTGSRSISEIDSSKTESASLSLSYIPEPMWRLNLIVGLSGNSATSEDTTFGSAGISYYW